MISELYIRMNTTRMKIQMNVEICHESQTPSSVSLRKDSPGSNKLLMSIEFDFESSTLKLLFDQCSVLCSMFV